MMLFQCKSKGQRLYDGVTAVFANTHQTNV